MKNSIKGVYCKLCPSTIQISHMGIHTKTNFIKLLEGKINDSHILIFDLDGTLIDTDLANLLSYKDAIQKIMKISINMSLYSNQRFTRHMLKQEIQALSKKEYDEITKLKNKLYNSYLDKTELNSILVEIINKYTKTNRIVLSTNSHKLRAIATLKYHDIFDTFDYIFFKEDNSNDINKFKYVLTQLNISPTSAIIFENEKLEIDYAILLSIPINNIISI